MPLLDKIIIGGFIWFVIVGGIMDYSEGWKLLTAIIPGVFVLLVSIPSKLWHSDKYRDDDDSGDGGGGY